MNGEAIVKTFMYVLLAGMIVMNLYLLTQINDFGRGGFFPIMGLLLTAFTFNTIRAKN